MRSSMAYVRSAEVTYAVRDTSIDEFSIKEGQLLGISIGIYPLNSFHEVLCAGIHRLTASDDIVHT